MTSHPTDKRSLQERLRRSSSAIYLATEKIVADDIFALQREAADRIDALEKALDRFVRIREWNHDESNSARREYDAAADAVRAALHPSDEEQAQAGGMK